MERTAKVVERKRKRSVRSIRMCFEEGTPTRYLRDQQRLIRQGVPEGLLTGSETMENGRVLGNAGRRR